ncbi:GumC family protein [Desulforegula conservatrix]|uniref:GumC family protein n=1 Tax=Desulforegula conservatrix TaxID=153026 RepID=UPI00048864AF
MNSIEKELNLQDYLRIIIKRRNIIIVFFVVTFITVFIGTLKTTPLYTATAKLMIERNASEPLKEYRYNLPQDPEFLETQFQIITSANVSKKVVEILKLTETYDQYFDTKKSFIKQSLASVKQYIKNIKESLSKSDHLKQAEPLSQADIIAEEISESVEVKPVRNSRIVSLSFSSPNPIFSSIVANTFAKAYKETILEMRMSSENMTREWMGKKADEERAKLEKSEKILQDYLKSKDMITIENKAGLVPERLGDLNSQLTKAENKENEIKAVYDKVKQLGISGAESIPDIINDTTYKALKEDIIKAEQNMMELSNKFGDKHPSMIKAQADLKILTDRKNEEVRRGIKTIENNYEIAKSQVESIKASLNETKVEATELNEKYIQYNILKRDVETNRQLYDALITKMKEKQITEQSQGVEIFVVDSAKTPEKQSKPNFIKNMLLAIVLGLFGGTGIAFFIEYLDDTIKTSEDTETQTGIPVLGSILQNMDKNQKTEGITFSDPSSQISEGYKTVRASLLLSHADSPPKTILVTSMSPDEGKTTTAYNLSISLALTGKKVIIIDADLRRPTIHKIGNLVNNEGASVYLSGTSELFGIQQGPVDGLDIMTSGPVPPNPSELLGSQRFRKLLTFMAQKYDYVIIDSPPLLAVSDTLIISKEVEGTIVIARSGKTKYEALIKGVKRFADINAKLLGIVVNCVDIKIHKYDYYASGYYYYGSGNEKSDSES